MASEDLTVRINGVSSHVDNGAANTSLSVFYQGFHLLIDAGKGVEESIKKGGASSGKYLPDAILITHARRHHISDLPALTRENAKVYCTPECSQQIAQELQTLPTTKTSSLQSSSSSSLFSPINPGTPFEVGPFSVIPIAADNAGDEPGLPGSVVYIIKAGAKKIVAGWDFLKLQTPDESILWNPDLLVLGTETYNEHPSTGMISVSEAYNIVRRWNAKLCYIVHYSGEKDREDAKNQWHRGPEGPLSAGELQKAIDGHLQVSGREGKFVIKVAKEGMTWSPQAVVEEEEGPIGPQIEVDALDQHIFSIEKMQDGKVAVTIEDRINRLTSEFVNPKLEGNSLHGEGFKTMMMKGPELNLSVAGNTLTINITKGKKAVFAEDLQVSEKDSKRIIRYLQENFSA
ncbi:MAG: MBL fold metallo-hydrolase [Thermoproteota archaeon]|nr:MBL fold metallo-hydrolase [Thermoproteota archaeon]